MRSSWQDSLCSAFNIFFLSLLLLLILRIQLKHVYLTRHACITNKLFNQTNSSKNHAHTISNYRKEGGFGKLPDDGYPHYGWSWWLLPFSQHRAPPSLIICYKCSLDGLFTRLLFFFISSCQNVESLKDIPILNNVKHTNNVFTFILLWTELGAQWRGYPPSPLPWRCRWTTRTGLTIFVITPLFHSMVECINYGRK